MYTLNETTLPLLPTMWRLCVCPFVPFVTRVRLLHVYRISTPARRYLAVAGCYGLHDSSKTFLFTRADSGGRARSAEEEHAGDQAGALELLSSATL